MLLSPHYYVLSLGARRATLFEAFRDDLIDVENQGFPVEASARDPAPGDEDPMRALVRVADHCLGHYYRNDPLGLVITGERELHSAFRSVTAHGRAVIGTVEGDHTSTPSRDLGQIVWPVVKEAMSGVLEDAMRDLASSAADGQLVCGLEDVAEQVNRGLGGVLLVEEGFHVTGRVGRPGEIPAVAPDVDVRDATDDAVDAVIARTLESGGRVVFAPRDSLADSERIVLVLRDVERS